MTRLRNYIFTHPWAFVLFVWRLELADRHKLKQENRRLREELEKAGPIQTRLNIVLDAIPEEVLHDHGVNIPLVYGSSKSRMEER